MQYIGVARTDAKGLVQVGAWEMRLMPCTILSSTMRLIIKSSALKMSTGETLTNADSIFHGTGEQERAVADLKQIMNQLTALEGMKVPII